MLTNPSPSSQCPRDEPPAEAGDGPLCPKRRIILVAIAMAILALTANFLPIADLGTGLDPVKVRHGLAIFACIAFLWLTEALPLAITALMVPVLATLFRVSDLKSAMTSFADPLIFLFFGGFAIAAAMSRQGLDRWIAQSLVRAAKGRFLAVACGLFAATALISMWISNTATTAMMIPLALGLLARIDGGTLNPRNTVFLLLGLAYSASVGGLGTVIGSPPNGIAAEALGMSFADWLKFGIPCVLLGMPLMVLTLFLCCRPDRNLTIRMEMEPLSFNAPRKITLTVFLAAAACWVASTWLAPAIGITNSFDTLVALTAVIVLVFSGVVRWREIEHGTDWGVLLLFGGGLGLSALLKDTGASLHLARLLGSAVDGWPLLLIVASVVLFVIFLTELTSNTACAALFVPVFGTLAIELGMPQKDLVMPLALAASCAFMMPVATPPNAIVFATGRVPQREMIRAGLLMNLAFVLLLVLISRWFH
jgi:sodium-dependent dicarboxylate transporter 2/3/5